jgi:hypothetical protein
MSYPINYPTPQNANIQTFNAGQTTGTQTWIKPQGASFVWFTLIGAGGGGGGVDSTNVFYGAGGGSGAVTNCLVPAFLIPDDLRILVGVGGTAGTTSVNGGSGTATSVIYQQKDGTGYTLLTANAGSGGTAGTGSNDAPAAAGGTASTSNYFSAMGIFQSVAGQDSTTGGTTQGASATTFLSGGTSALNVTGNYGYTVTGNNKPGFFQTQPIIVGVSTSFGNTANKAPIGCGGFSNANLGICGIGGNGMATIISW